MGDVISITDAQGNELVEYEYDEWGKLILTRADNQLNESIANINPIRYRGYYYDTETGYYYLQSRYYDPSICRFINADDYKYAEIQKEDYVGFNLFAYCYNEPINNSDYEGFALSESSLITYFIEDQLLKNKYIARRGKTYTDKTGAKVKEIKYRKYFNVYEVVRISYGKKNNWQKGISIANNCSSKTINHYFNVMGNSLINVSASSGKSIGSAMASAAVIIISLSSASKKAATINKYYQKVWGSKGIDPKNKYGYFLICVTKDKKLNGWYIIRSNGRGYKKL